MSKILLQRQMHDYLTLKVGLGICIGSKESVAISGAAKGEMQIRGKNGTLDSGTKQRRNGARNVARSKTKSR